MLDGGLQRSLALHLLLELVCYHPDSSAGRCWYESPRADDLEHRARVARSAGCIAVAGSASGVSTLNGRRVWTPSNRGIEGGPVTVVALSPAYASDRTVFAGAEEGGVFKSTDGGASGAAMNAGLARLDVRDLALSPAYATDRTIFAAAGQGCSSQPTAAAPAPSWAFVTVMVALWRISSQNANCQGDAQYPLGLESVSRWGHTGR